MQFEFATARQIIFGAGQLKEVGKLAAKFGTRALVVATRNVERAAPLLDILKNHHIAYELFSVDGEPSIEQIQAGVEYARTSGCELIISFGGGSVIDSGKAIAALVTNEGEPLDYLEVIGKGKPLENAPLPFIAIPTTAGTGAEVTRNAVLSSPKHQLKVSLRSPLMLPKIALVDPELTYSLPPEVTASTGMDALTQLIEPFTSNAANPLTDSLCREGIQRAARSLKTAFDDGSYKAAREDMALASLFGGLALANAKLGAVHGFAGPLGGMFPIPHGTACAALLPYVMETNIRALRERQPESETLIRYAEVARLLTGRADATPEDGVEWVQELRKALNISSLSQFGIQAKDLPEIAEKSANASSMKGNPIELTRKELIHTLEMATVE